MSPTLRDLTDDLLQVEQWVDEHADEILVNGGALPPHLAELLDGAEGAFRVKVERIGSYILELAARESALRVERERLAQRVTVTANLIAGLKSLLKAWLTVAQVPSVKGMLLSVRVQANSQPTVVVPSGSYAPNAMGEPPCAVNVLRYVPEQTIAGHYVYDRTKVLAAAEAYRADPEHAPALPDGCSVTWGSHVRVS